MTGYLIFWGVSLVALAGFVAYWVRRLDRGHQRRMETIAATEAMDHMWLAGIDEGMARGVHPLQTALDAAVRRQRDLMAGRPVGPESVKDLPGPPSGDVKRRAVG